MSHLQYGTTSIDYSLSKEKRNDIKITVTLVNGVVIHTPENHDPSQLEKVLQQKAPWIIQKLQALNEVEKTVALKEFVSGEKLPYLGRQYRLKIYKNMVSAATLRFKQGRFIAVVPREWAQSQIQYHLEQKLITWYRTHGLKKVNERVRKYQSILGVEAQSVQLKTQHKRWGSCTPTGDIYVNWRIVMAPVHVMDYIIVHELSHLLVPEHNDRFWQIVKNILPHYKDAKEWLRVHGVELHCIAAN